MLDFMVVVSRNTKQGNIEISPDFIFPYPSSKDLMIRGGDFYAIWDEEVGRWSTNEADAIRLIDNELDHYVKEKISGLENMAKVMYMRNSSSGSIDRWHKYVQKQCRDSYKMLDEKLIFSNDKCSRTDYASKSLPYPLNGPGLCPGYDKLMETLYAPEERHKLEWAVGSIVNGASKNIQKFIVLYGDAGTGKSTFLEIVRQLFDGYETTFDAKALGSASREFALEPFRTNPLVAIQHDGDLSHIEDNTRLNSLVSHEFMSVNEKYAKSYSAKFKCFLFMGTNKPVKITDAKSGILRRLINVSPTGNKLSPEEYRNSVAKIPFELSAIAWRCKEVYESDPDYYDSYIPLSMMSASNDFYNFVEDAYPVFNHDGYTTMSNAWKMYKQYIEEARVPYPYTLRVFKEELKNYFREYKERATLDDGTRVWNYYGGFKTDKFDSSMSSEPSNLEKITPEMELDKFKTECFHLDGQKSTFDVQCSEWTAQYAKDDGSPRMPWSSVKTKLKDLDTSKMHYVLFPENRINHIVIDFDKKDENGNKSLLLNLKAASEFPSTYTELSKSGCGVHLHYIYDGDPKQLSRIYEEDVEIKVYTGLGGLRRKLTAFNELPIAKISSGLPIKEESGRVLDFKSVKSERGLRQIIERNLRKEIHPSTAQSINFIAQILDDAYSSNLKYDVSDMRNDIVAFAAQSTHQSEQCIRKTCDMKFKSDEPSVNKEYGNEDAIVFFDCEVFPNLFLVNWKYQGKENGVNRMINPSAAQIEDLVKKKLVGFNNRQYDNHILYARMIGYNNEEIYKLSQRLVSDEKGKFAGFGEAYNLSYTDVYDFSSKKQSLKKFEIELGIHHQELGLPWDKPVPESMWGTVAEYCDNDVIATEAVFEARQADFIAREILADLAGMTVNDKTNSLSGKIIFGENKHPQDAFNYRDMGDTSAVSRDTISCDNVLYTKYGDDFTVFDDKNRPVFPGYTYSYGISKYRGEEIGEGGYVYAEPGMYADVALLDIASMHPSSIIAENLFGDEYTKRFKELLDARLVIKHKEFDKARNMLGGVLAKYLDNEDMASALSKALKIVINSVYGLTAAKFENRFRDSRNVDNIVAKRGELFMINLKHEVQNRGYTVAHIKTDSIKIPNASPKIIQFVMEYGKMYGYNFEHEATYEKMCLVNDSVYIAKFASEDQCLHSYGYSPDECTEMGGQWTATGKQFAVPYVYKSLFSKEPITFEDMTETYAVKTSLYLDMNENMASDADLVKSYDKQLKRLIKDGMSYEEAAESLSNLKKDIDALHDYHFVGKVGCFVPVVKGTNGGILCRKSVNKQTGAVTYAAPSGSTGYRWLLAEDVRELKMENSIDKRYYNALVDDAVSNMSKYGDVEYFLSDAKFITYPTEDDLPWN